MVKIKICGLKRIEDIEFVNEFKPDYVGFVFAESKRRVSAAQAKLLVDNLNPCIKKVGVFVNETWDKVEEIAALLKLEILQFHGEEDNEYMSKFKEYEIWKAVNLNCKGDLQKLKQYKAQGLVVDSDDGNKRGGTGRTFDWSLLEKFRSSIKAPLIAAGGLKEDNVEECIKRLMPFCVDVSSGVETNGFKDRKKIENFIRKVRNFK